MWFHISKVVLLSVSDLNYFSTKAIAHLDWGCYIALNWQEDLVSLWIWREHDSELIRARLCILEGQVDESEVELNDHSLYLIFVAEVVDGAMVWVVQLEVGLQPLQRLLLVRLFCHLHHLRLRVSPPMSHVLSVVAACALEAPENDNVLLVCLDRDINLFAIHLGVDHFKAF